MGELQDYSGEFRADLRLEDFAKQALVRLFKTAGAYAESISTYWTNLITEKYGLDVASELSKEIWLKRGASQAEIAMFSEAMNIHGDNPAAYIKALQVDVAFMGMDAVYEMRDKNHGTVTVRNCRVLKQLEEYGIPELQKLVCEELDMVGYGLGASHFNPKIEVTPVKLPLRQGPNDICCKWRVSLEEQGLAE